MLLQLSPLLGLTLASCSTNAATTGGTSGSHTTSASSGAGGAGGSGGASCLDPMTAPSAACGALSFEVSTVTSRKRNHHGTFLATSKAGTNIYVAGGANANTVMDNVDRYAVNTDGSLGAGVADTPLPHALGGFTGGVVSNVIVIAGGMGSSGVESASYSTVIADDGSLGAWTSAGSVLKNRMHPGSVVSGSSIYVMGGFEDPMVWDDIVRATVNADGTVSPWAAAGTLPGPRSHFSVTLVGDYVYLAGGLDKSAFSDPPDLNETWRGHIASDGTIGEWSAMPALPVALATHSSFFYGGYLYVGGGINNAPAQEKRMWRAAVNANHSLGAWEATMPLPIARGHVHQLPVFQNHVYSFSGAIDFNLDSTDQIDIGTFQ